MNNRMEEQLSSRSHNIWSQLRQARKEFRADEQHLSSLIKRVMCIDRHLLELSRKQQLRKLQLQKVTQRQSLSGRGDPYQQRCRYKTDQSLSTLPRAMLQDRHLKVAKHDKIRSERERSRLTRQNFFQKKKEQAANLRMSKLAQLMDKKNNLKRMVADLEAEEASGLEKLEQSICRHDNMREEISTLLSSK